MLQTQVNYWNLVEQKRHNLSTESQSRQDLAELVRHNQLTERLGFFNYAETAKHNRAQESYQFGNLGLNQKKLSEDVRSHQAQEALGWANVGVARANARTNQFNAFTQARKVGYDNINTQYANRTGRINAYTNEANATIREMELQQTKRANDIREAEIPSKYLGNLPRIDVGKGNVVRKITKTTVKRVKTK